MSKKTLLIKPGDVISVEWLDFVSVKYVPKTLSSFVLPKLKTYGEVVGWDDIKLAIMHEIDLNESDDKNEGFGALRAGIQKIRLYREVGEAEIPDA